MKKNPIKNVQSAERRKTYRSTTKKEEDRRRLIKKLLSRSASLAQGSMNSTPISIVTKGSDAIKESSGIRVGLDSTAIFHSFKKILGKEFWHTPIGNSIAGPCCSWRVNGIRVTLWLGKECLPDTLKIYYGDGYNREVHDMKILTKYLVRSYPAHTEAAREACHYLKRYGKIP